jgi:hypothetical protein
MRGEAGLDEDRVDDGEGGRPNSIARVARALVYASRLGCRQVSATQPDGPRWVVRYSMMSGLVSAVIGAP